jgi:hypothetical protein
VNTLGNTPGNTSGSIFGNILDNIIHLNISWNIPATPVNGVKSNQMFVGPIPIGTLEKL